MAQEIKAVVRSKSNYQYETFDVGNKAILFDDKKEKDVIAAIDELGLEGQKNLIKSQAGLIIPFPKMNAQEERVWKEYCPVIDKLEAYQATTIPFEILTMIQLVKQKKYFDIETTTTKIKQVGHLEIWSEAREDIDPLLVGVINTKQKLTDGSWQYSGEDSYYLIARWGISLRPYDEIRDVAIERWKKSRTGKLVKKIQEAKFQMETLDADANKFFGGDFVSDIY